MLVFLFQSGGVVVFLWNIFVVVKFEDLVGDVIKEVMVVGNCYYGVFEVVQEVFQSGDGFGVEVVGWFVEQQYIWFFQQQMVQCDVVVFIIGKISDFCILVWQVQGVGCVFQLDVQVVVVVCLDNFFEFVLLCGKFIEVCIWFGVFGIDFVQFFQCVNYFGDCFFYGFVYGVFWVELWFLWQVVDFDVGLWMCFIFDFGVDIGYDVQQGRFIGVVQIEYIDFCVREKVEGDIF